MNWYFVFFFVSGFCSILYEVIWLRLAMAHFGVTTAMISIVLSAFMGGLGLGSWGSGYLIRGYGNRIKFPPLRLYAITELLIGASAITVPYLLFSGRQFLQQTISRTFLSSAGHYLPAGIWVTVTLVPWCACMGATFPLAMLAIRNSFGPQSDRSFSYLYLANVLGAVAGATVPLLLIELLGFYRTLYVGAALNFSLASCAFGRTLLHFCVSRIEPDPRPEDRIAKATSGTHKRLLWLLFGTGLTSMGAEIIWIRLYTPSVGTFVYAFAIILALYLAATYLGSWFYRCKGRAQSFESGLLWAVLGFSVLLPFLTVDPRLPLPPLLRVFLGVVPFSAIVGFVTPMIVDLYSLGDPNLAGSAYAMNIIGCVVGPLVSGFVLLPLVGERFALCLFALPWFAVIFLLRPFQWGYKPSRSLLGYAALAAASLFLAIFAEGFEQQFAPRKVLRDSTATVIATGSGHGKRLLINGVGITALTPVTKMMAHLPLAFLPQPPAKALIICFGMGTSYRSALSWHIPSTAVELVPSVPVLFSFFHPDGPVGVGSPLSHVVTDDGRSYLEQTLEKYDVIVIDPPPPVGAAASSLLYSKEFYAIAKERLQPGGILQQWLPAGDAATRASVARALEESFPYVRVFTSIEHVGFHFLASMSPIPSVTAAQLAQRLPPDASHDLMEWGPTATPEEQFQAVLEQEVPVVSILQEDPKAPALQDDRPVNEYFVIRRLSEPGYLKKLPQRLLRWTGPS
jgi:spermidine synthase